MGQIYEELADIHDYTTNCVVNLFRHTFKVWDRMIDRRLFGDVDIVIEKFGLHQ